MQKKISFWGKFYFFKKKTVLFWRFFCFLRPAFGHGRLGHPQSLEYYFPIGFVGYTLESCLENFFSPQEIERRCEHCGSENSTQVTTFVQEPATLILQLNRFKYSQVDKRVIKIHEPLIFPTIFQMPGGSSYKIVATINHIGETANSGHYTSLIFDPDKNSFILVDDDRITPSVGIDEEICQQVYMLVYTKLWTCILQMQFL